MDYFDIHAHPDQIRGVSTLGLAHIGDAVFELMVRSRLCLHGKATNKGLHRATVALVATPAQARMAQKILPILTEEEMAVYRRGRNQSPHAVPKAAFRGEYQSATGVEALFGDLWLRGERERLNVLFERMMEE